MSDILRIIEKYQNLDESFLLNPEFAQDVQLLNTLMKSADEKSKFKAITFLENIQNQIEAEVLRLQHNLKDKPNTLERIRKNANACLAYTKNNDRKG